VPAQPRNKASPQVKQLKHNNTELHAETGKIRQPKLAKTSAQNGKNQ
jgi:hypothetical protein